MEDVNPNQLWVENSALDARLGFCCWECEAAPTQSWLNLQMRSPCTQGPVFADKACASGAVRFKPMLLQAAALRHVGMLCGTELPEREGTGRRPGEGSVLGGSAVRGEAGRGKPTVLGA